MKIDYSVHVGMTNTAPSNPNLQKNTKTRSL